MAKRGKKYKAVHEALDRKVSYSIQEGVTKVTTLAYARFDESVDAAIVLGINPTRGEEAVRGSVLLPHGTGKSVKILVFARGEYADQAEKAGADYVGSDEFISRIESGWLDFDYAIATPDLMGLVGRVAKILGPRGLLPNKKNDTVTFDVASVVHELRQGRLFFKNDKAGVVHVSFGKISQGAAALADNFVAFVKALSSAKPATSKGKFIKKATVSSTMGPGLVISVDDI